MVNGLAAAGAAGSSPALRSPARKDDIHRFIPVQSSEDAQGAWQRYYQDYEQMTFQKIDYRLLELVPELALFVPPARMVDKATYSPW